MISLGETVVGHRDSWEENVLHFEMFLTYLRDAQPFYYKCIINIFIKYHIADKRQQGPIILNITHKWAPLPRPRCPPTVLQEHHTVHRSAPCSASRSTAVATATKWPEEGGIIILLK